MILSFHWTCYLLNSDYQNTEWYQLTTQRCKCGTEGMIEVEYENRAWQLRRARFFSPSFHHCFALIFLTNFFLFFFVYTFKKLTEVYKCVRAVYGPYTAEEFKVLNH